MIDFIEYVVAELKSRRLSRQNALTLIKQFTLRSSNRGAVSVIHPLLHRNTSDMSQQSYCSTFTGEEFFLADHRVEIGNDGGKRVLPGVAYLEMARAAVEQALPDRENTGIVELRNTIWAQPIVVEESKEVSIALFANDNDQLEYEVYSLDGDGEDGSRETIHCRGHVVLSDRQETATLDLEQLKGRMRRGTREPASVYTAYAGMGLHYGRGHQAITAIYTGENELIADLRLPESVGASEQEYLLHPSLLDGALQSAIGLLPDWNDIPHTPSVPFALEYLRVLKACTREMRAWVRYSAGSRPEDTITRLDIDLTDHAGNVCVQMRGFTSRVLTTEKRAAQGSGRATDTLFAAPHWEPAAPAAHGARQAEYEQHHVVLCEMPWIDVAQLEASFPGCRCLFLNADPHKNIAGRYSEYALACFELLRSIARDKPRGSALVQVAAAGSGEQSVFAGLSGLLKTATLENPRIVGTILLAQPEITTAELAGQLRESQNRPQEKIVAYGKGARHVLRWREIEASRDTPKVAFKDHGVYLITGGLGRLGVLFAEEILRQTTGARIIITGRAGTAPDRSAALEALTSLGGVVEYRQMQLDDAGRVREVIAGIKTEYKQLNGILHCAGASLDNFILKKTAEEFGLVLAPKVLGVVNLDEASRDIDLDFIVLFSSIVAVTGNSGQADYAAANAFMDQFADYRNQLAARNERRGRMLAVNWPLWQEGGMRVDEATWETMLASTGMRPLRTETGVSALYRSLELPHGRVLVVEGDISTLRRTMFDDQTAQAEISPARAEGDTPADAELDADSLEEKTQSYIKKQLSALLKLPAHKIDPHAPLEKYGIDSILAMNLTSELEKTFGSLSKTLFFEYQTIQDLTGYFIDAHRTTLASLLAAADEGRSRMQPVGQPPVSPAGAMGRRREKRKRLVSVSTQAGQRTLAEPVAIVGLSGRYPESTNIREYWRNLRDGKDCIIEVPKDRWDWREYYSEDRTKSGHHFSKWGGFITGVDEFDPLFFNMTPLEAEIIDPQERLFLQHAWTAVEDAGYTRAGLQIPHTEDLPGQVGVYVGVMYGEYQLFGAQASVQGKRMAFAGNLANIANRVSYVLNLHGPCMTLDTMCSSSLTAVHVACQDLKQGRTDLAIAGGVNISIHPNKYLMLSAGQFISSDGHCQSFGEGGDGYIPGEGVGAVVLKRLSEARRDGNHIYGIIRGSALNHGGKTNGYTVPNPQAQAGVIRRALAEANIDPRHVSYIEAHGTGTKLGDPIEIAALSKAFQRSTRDTGFCLIGSAKSNIGHCESAAGIAGLTKVLLQMKYRQIAPSLHSSRLNPNIDFKKTPFIVNQTLRSWDRPVIDGITLPRIAGLSSFGAGGSNAHILLEEFQEERTESAAVTAHHAPVVIPLSARTAEQLKERARELLDFIRTASAEDDREEHGEQAAGAVDLHAMAYTLQVGREAMEERMGFLVTSVGQLADKLGAYLDGEQDIEDAYQGKMKNNRDTLSLFNTDADLQQTIDKWIARKKLSKLLDLWTKGLDLDWSKLYGETKPRRISLPTYPFAKNRYWIDTSLNGRSAAGGPVSAVLHPLLHRNTSDLSRQRYSSTFSGEESFLADHQVKLNGGAAQKVLPGAAYLEMARAAMENAAPEEKNSSIVELRNTVWAQPAVVRENKEINIALYPNGTEQLEYEIYSSQEGEDVMHCRGHAVFTEEPAPAMLDISKLKGQMGRGRLDAAGLYPLFAEAGLVYGAAHRGISYVYRGEKEALARIRLPALLEAGLPAYVLHPSLMDSALQSAVGLLENPEDLLARRSLPFALESLRVYSACAKDMFAWVRYAPGSDPGDTISKLDIDICDGEGNVCVQMRGFSSRSVDADEGATGARTGKIGTLFAVPQWEPRSITAPSGASRQAYARQHIILCETAHIQASHLEGLIPGSRCLALDVRGEDIAQRYSEAATVCFEELQTIVKDKPRGKVLVQIVIAEGQERSMYAGLSGLLKTAALENPQIAGQIILADPQMGADELAAHLQMNGARPQDQLIKYEQGERRVLRWKEIPFSGDSPPVAFKDRGVYLITGGMGGLGVLFAGEILEQAKDARIILTGRSELTKAKREVLEALSAQAGQVVYRQADITKPDHMRELFAGIVREYKRLSGIIHAAGTIQDNFILRKTPEEFKRVLAPKVAGTFNLDTASAEVEIEFLALFSSVAGAMGNAGQADYAAANGFMDQYAAYRDRLTATRRRHGKTLVINWPFWRDGGMHLDQRSRELLARTIGIEPLRTGTGLEAFYRSMAMDHVQTLVVEGDVPKMRRLLSDDQAGQVNTSPDAEMSPDAPASPAIAETDQNSLVVKTREYLRKEFSELLKLPAHEIDAKVPLENYGIDSVLAMKLTSKLEEVFGSLSKTLFFEYQTLAGLAGYLVAAYPGVVRAKVEDGPELQDKKAPGKIASVQRSKAKAGRPGSRFLGSGPKTQREVAIVGVSGKYPQAENLDEFWENLKAGKDCVTEIPPERWDNALYYHPDRNQAGKSYSKWGGFISDVDKFDALFFNISPKEAELIDPQERLFMETVWQAIEDAGYSKEGVSEGRVGVYVGVMWGHYELYGADALLAGNAHVPSSSYASIANRVSYFFNFNGPSIALDTMCSSSLTAIHLACEDIRKGEIDAAVAGGVNVSVHPQKYLNLSQGNFVSSDGRCRSFGKGGDGYVPGEGVGAILLKSLDKALQDGDQIYAVIKSSAINHGGKTNGYTVPNPNAQGELILDALRKANIDPKTLSYLETHGTGTSLGDPIEITGLLKAFNAYTEEKQICPIGSVKSNIGHLESAAGIAAVTKALLQIKHETLVPSLHADTLNPNIDFAQTPFYVQRELTTWKRPSGYPRRVGVSSFGAGGANAHLILEEHAPGEDPPVESHPDMTEAVVLSAKDTGALVRYAEKFAAFLGKAAGISLMNIAYTSQVGRTPMNERLVVLASSLEELQGKLHLWTAMRKQVTSREAVPPTAMGDVFSGNVKDVRATAGDLMEGAAGEAFLRVILERRDLAKLAKLWLSGVEIDWPLLYRHARPRRVSLPTYPFARERYWINVPATAAPFVPQVRERGTAGEADPEKEQMSHYLPRWTESPPFASKDKPLAEGSLLILDTTDELFHNLKHALGEDGGRTPLMLVRQEQSGQATEHDMISIDPEQEDQIVRLVERLKKEGRLPRYILHRCSGPENPDRKDLLDGQLKYGLYTLFNLCKALMKQKTQMPLQILSFFSGKVPAPHHAALGGFFKTLALENPKYRAKVVEIVENSEITVPEKARLMLNELRDNDWNRNEIRYIFDEGRKSYARHVRELVRFSPAKDGRSELPLKQQGVYIISGGLGGLGLIFSEYLAREFQARLVLFGRSELSAEQEKQLNRLRAFKTDILYLRADASRAEDMEAVVKAAKGRFSQINGVIHSAGINRDSFILRKTRAEMEQVLEAKVYGAIHLDAATRKERLDLFVLFSSVAGVVGNIGQCDYAFANGFIDSFAESREYLRKRGKRSGRTLSINWPYWAEGGMTVSQNDIALVKKQTGLCPLPVREGIRYWEDFLRSDVSQGMALYGIESKIRSYIDQTPPAEDMDRIATAKIADPSLLAQKAESYIKTIISEEIKLATERIDSGERFESFGMDSMMINRINMKLEADLGAMPKTLFYEYETIGELAGYLSREARPQLIRFFRLEVSAEGPDLPRMTAEAVSMQSSGQEKKNYDEDERIAIIGVHGYYPHSADLDAFWENLKRGKDLIDLVPRNRWDYEEFYDPDPAKAAEGKIYCKWGGFLDDFDKFDPRFFNISPEEARIIDPQERLFLQSVWAAIEDAGYTRDSLKRLYPKAKSADVGVYVGVTTNSYHLLAPEEWSRGNMVTPGAMPWSIANRISYFFDFQGPSLPIDTACSSSLVAIHLACESLRKQECRIAVAGGVNLYLHPSKYQSFCQRRMVSLHGKCRSFGAGDDGFVPGEGVGAIVLKPMSSAIKDGDHIYAVIRGSAFDHSGRSNGYSAPNPGSQAHVIEHALKKAGVDPETIGYVEGHGTGTQLGDSLEITALTNAFRKFTTNKRFCPVGSVKANVGHSESAAGIAGVAKILMQFKHKQLAPTIHSEEVNPNIDFAATPFYLQRELAKWESPNHPRRALINSFGAGGVNACVVLEEYERRDASGQRGEAGPYLFVLSARNEDRLREYANRMLAYLGKEKNLDLSDVSYTLQTGREAMQERLAIVYSGRKDLMGLLKDWRQQVNSDAVYRGSLDPGRSTKKAALTSEDAALSAAVDQEGLEKLAERWCAGGSIDWASFHPDHTHARIPMPVYPFAKERYWVSDSLVPERRTPARQKNGHVDGQLHPLISCNSSTLREVRFSSLLSGGEFYAQDHQVNGERIFPGAGFLEMACVSGTIAGERKVRKIRDVVWIQPLRFQNGSHMVQTFLTVNENSIEYNIASLNDQNEKVPHSEGKLDFQHGGSDELESATNVSIQQLKEQCSKHQDGGHYYSLFSRAGFHYGAAFKTIQEFYVNHSYALSKLRIADALKNDFDRFVLHPSIIDGALQTVVGLVGSQEPDTPHLPFAIEEVEIFRPLPHTCYAYAEFADREKGAGAGVKKFNVRLLSESGALLMEFKNFAVRSFGAKQALSSKNEEEISQAHMTGRLYE